MSDNGVSKKFIGRKEYFLTKIDNVHVNIIMLHVDIIYLACRGQKYATINVGLNEKLYSFKTSIISNE